MPKSDVGEI